MWLRGKQFVYWIIAVLAVLIGVTLYLNNIVFFLNGPDNGFLLTKSESVRRSVYLPAFYIHVATGSAVLMAGVLQLSTTLRRRSASVHRAVGKLYIFTTLLFTAPSGFVMALYANGGLTAQTAFALLAACWWWFTFKGLQTARSGSWNRHRAFMLRSYALTFAAVTLRLYSFFFALAGLRGVEIYDLIAWLCWVPSLLVTEWWLQKRKVQL